MRLTSEFEEVKVNHKYFTQGLLKGSLKLRNDEVRRDQWTSRALERTQIVKMRRDLDYFLEPGASRTTESF